MPPPHDNSANPDASHGRLRAVLCGSFHRDRRALRSVFRQLKKRFHVLSPRSLEFLDPNAAFVRLPDEVDVRADQVERAHLDAMRRVDFVWLHAPDGYLGPSGAMELGYARAFGIPVLGTVAPCEDVFRDAVTVVSDFDAIEEALLRRLEDPGAGLSRLQRYYHTVAKRRGWSNESARDSVLLLTEELGELARAVRVRDRLPRHQQNGHADVEEELADIQLYLVHLANVLDLDLADAVTSKERINAVRFARAHVA